MKIEELRALEQAATPGPWEYRWPEGKGSPNWIVANDERDFPIIAEPRQGIVRPSDTALITAARNNLAALLDVAEGVKKLSERWETDSQGYYDFDEQAVVDALSRLENGG